MNTRMFAHDAGLVTAVTAVVTGAGFVAWSVAGVVHERDRLRASAAGPRPTVTATVVRRVPYPEPSPVRATRTVEAASQPSRPSPGGVTAQEAPSPGRTSRTGGGGPGRAPRPSPAPSCRPGVLSVRLPLGALPCNAITIGGSH